MEDINHLDATDQDIIKWCTQWRQSLFSAGSGRNRKLGANSSNNVLQLNDDAIVKSEPLVTTSEAANQQFAWHTFQPHSDTLCVPRVYRFFQDRSLLDRSQQEVTGYLLMEFVLGRRLSELPQTEAAVAIENVARAIQCMSQIEGDKPGPVDGGEPAGPMWAPDNRAYEKFSSIDDLEAWFDRALVKERKTIDLHRHRLSLCHLDLSRHNILVVDDRTICLLDWASAGFFPSIFEVWNLHVASANDSWYRESLLGLLPCLDKEDQDTEWLLWCTYRWNMLNEL